MQGYPATISDDGQSAEFDAAVIFPKVLESGSAALWDWQCEFLCEHTYLTNYRCIDDIWGEDTQGQERIECEIEAVDNNNVRITWGIDIREEYSLAIDFGAVYKGGS